MQRLHKATADRQPAPPASLPPLEEPCAKCGADGPARQWIGAGSQRSGQGADRLAFMGDLGPWPACEFLLSTCQACGYVWAAACLDHPERTHTDD